MSVPVIPGQKITEDLAHGFRQEIAQLLHRQNVNFPGAQPISFARHHLMELQREDYYLCEKTDGIRCLLYCTIGDDPSQEIHYLIDRKNDFYYVQKLHFPMYDDPNFGRFHKETLLDGELVLDLMPDGSHKLRYLVFDCLVMDKELLLKKTLDKRLGRFQAWMYQPWVKMCKKFPNEVQYFPFEIGEKTMQRAYGLDMMFFSVLPNLPHGNDGLVFTCRHSPYVTGTDDHILKWKPAHENSIDFRLALGKFPAFDPEDGEDGLIEDYEAKPTFDLLVHYNKKDDRRFEALYVTDEDWEAMKRMGQVLDGRIIECHRDAEGRWRYKRESDGSPRFRDDKSEANHISTVTKVLQSIEDGVTEQELRGAAKDILMAWKQRHPEERRPGEQQS